MIASIRYLLAVMLVLVTTSASQAAVSLSDLISNNGNLIVGNSLRFDSFTYAPTGTAPSANSVKVDTITDASGNYGLRFIGGFVDHTDNGPSTMYITYNVSALTAATRITSAGLAGNPVVIGLGQLVMTETFKQAPTVLEVFDKEPGGTSLADSHLLPSSVSSLSIRMSVVGDARKGATTSSFFDNTFGQTTDNVVPEPSSALIWLATMMLGSVAIGLYRHRCNAKSATANAAAR